MFTRLLYIGKVQLHMADEEFWLTPIGLTLDLWEAHRQFNGWSKPMQTIDDVIPY